LSFHFKERFMLATPNSEVVSELANISASKCEIEFLSGSKPCRGKPMADRKDGTEQTGRLTTFRHSYFLSIR
jgi:hypothetical protein